LESRLNRRTVQGDLASAPECVAVDRRDNGNARILNPRERLLELCKHLVDDRPALGLDPLCKEFDVESGAEVLSAAANHERLEIALSQLPSAVDKRDDVRIEDVHLGPPLDAGNAIAEIDEQRILGFNHYFPGLLQVF